MKNIKIPAAMQIRVDNKRAAALKNEFYVSLKMTLYQRNAQVVP